MKFRIYEKDETVILEVECIPYTDRRRNPRIKREFLERDKAQEIIRENGYKDYIPAPKCINRADNKHHSGPQSFIFVKKPAPKKVQTKLDKKEESVVESPITTKKTRRKRRSYRKKTKQTD